MRFHKLRLQNFKLFEDQEFEFHPNFNLLVGENGCGKTSILDGLAVAMGIWLANSPDPAIANSKRNIRTKEIRDRSLLMGDRRMLVPELPVTVTASVDLPEMSAVSFCRQIKSGQTRTTNSAARGVLNHIWNLYQRAQAGEQLLLPVLAYYGAGRVWLPSNKKSTPTSENRPARRWDAFYYCLDEHVRIPDILDWFRDEASAVDRPRPGFIAVKHAITTSIPGATDVYWESDLRELVLIVNGEMVRFNSLSSGQRGILLLFADLSIKCVTQNSHLNTPPQVAINPPRVLCQTPGVVLIDELDVHLHPQWQRRVVNDLRQIFPAIQFVTTSHSPQVIGETPAECVWILNREGSQIGISHPEHSLGLDSARILSEYMGATRRSTSVIAEINEIGRAIDAGHFDEARSRITQLEGALGVFDADLVNLSTLLDLVEAQ